MTVTGLYPALLAVQAEGDAAAEGTLLRNIIPTPRCRDGADPYERLLSKIAFGVTDCWHWIGYVDELGYGRIARTLGEVKAHRFAYRCLKGDIPAHLEVMHSCDVRGCVNPAHLSLGTHAENVRDMVAKGRRRSGDISGERNGMARLTRADVAEIRRLKAEGVKQVDLARRFGVSPMTVSRAIRKESWR